MHTKATAKQARKDYLASIQRVRKARRQLIQARATKRDKATITRRKRIYERTKKERSDRKRVYAKAKARANRPMRVRALDEAIRLTGTLEQGGNNRGKVVEAIIKANGGPGPEPWCGDFVAWCYRRAGSTVVNRTWAAAHAGIWGWFTGVIRLRRIKNMKPGHITEYTWQHTGLFEKWIDKAAGDFWAREGNTRANSNVSDAGGGEGVHRVKRNVSQVAGAFSPQR